MISASRSASIAAWACCSRVGRTRLAGDRDDPAPAGPFGQPLRPGDWRDWSAPGRPGGVRCAPSRNARDGHGAQDWCAGSDRPACRQARRPRENFRGARLLGARLGLAHGRRRRGLASTPPPSGPPPVAPTGHGRRPRRRRSCMGAGAAAQARRARRLPAARASSRRRRQIARRRHVGDMHQADQRHLGGLQRRGRALGFAQPLQQHLPAARQHGRRQLAGQLAAALALDLRGRGIVRRLRHQLDAGQPMGEVEQILQQQRRIGAGAIELAQQASAGAASPFISRSKRSNSWLRSASPSMSRTCLADLA